MRNVLPMLLVALTLGAFAAPAAAQNGPKIAYVNTQRVLAEAPAAQAAQQSFEQAMQGYQQELQKLEQELQTLVTNYQQRESMLSAAAKQEQQNQIRQKQVELQQRAGQLEQEAMRRQQELVGPVMEQIQSAIDALRVEGGYAIIFDASSGSIVAADPSLDLTDQVLARLRSTARNN